MVVSQIHFTKMQGCGNDFVILDCITQNLQVTPALVKKIADRKLGIGCDQVLVVDPPHDATCDFTYRIFNPDGKEVEQCGNGARCFGRYVIERGLIAKRHLLLDTLGGKITVDVSDLSHILVDMGVPQLAPQAIPINLKSLVRLDMPARYKIALSGIYHEVSILSMGNPHCIISVPSTKEADVENIGKMLQKNPAFTEGVNVTFMQVLARNHIRCRVFERGAGETLACGSAACAAMVSGVLQKELSAMVRVDMPGGHVTVRWEPDARVMQSGPAVNVFQGVFAVNMPSWEE